MSYPVLVALKQCWIPASAMIALVAISYAITEYSRRAKEKRATRSPEKQKRSA